MPEATRLLTKHLADAGMHSPSLRISFLHRAGRLSTSNDRRTIMKFSYSYACVVLALSTAGAAAADDKSKEKPLKPCTIRSPSSGAFFDLNSLYIHPPGKDSKSSKNDDKPESWHARGYDYGSNFTLNFCGPVVEELGRVEGVSHSKNISAFYKSGGKTFSIGYVTFCVSCDNCCAYDPYAEGKTPSLCFAVEN